MAKVTIDAKKLLKFPCVDVVEASAGSGKTYALVKRYVRLIINPGPETGQTPLKAIFAVTFTNKATIEMKQRILELLKRIALNSFSDKNEKNDIFSSFAVEASSAEKIARSAVNDIISRYNFFQVQTIDSFINMLLKGCAFRLGFASDFRIKKNHLAYLEYSLDKLIDRAASDKKILNIFRNFLDYYLFVENKDGWFSKEDILSLIKTLYGYSNTYGGMFRKPDKGAKNLRVKKQEIIKIIGDIAPELPVDTNKRFVKSICIFLEKNKSAFDIEKLSKYFEKEVFPVNKRALVPENIAKLWDKARKNLALLCEWESTAIFRPYIDIFNLTMDEFGKLAGNDEVIFLEELNSRAQGLADDKAVTVGEIYYRLATRFRHYLIDEFQDTNRLQWKNMRPMVEEALSSAGSLFCVGDKKQAIFRFRGGDVSLFDSIRNDFRNLNPKETVLSKNYRSQKEIVEFNNGIFSRENLNFFMTKMPELQKDLPSFSDEDFRKVTDVFKDSKQTRKEENKYGCLRIEAFESPTVDEKNIVMRKKLISLIKRLRKRFPAGDIAILTRENRDSKLFTSWLLEENIPVESERTLSIREHPLIKELVSFLVFLNSPINDLSFASFILGSIFQRASGISRDEITDFLFSLRINRRKEKGIYLYRNFRKRFPAAWDSLIDEFFKNAGFAPLYELMITVLGKFEVLKSFPGCQGFFMKLLEIIKEKEEDYSGISSFLELFEEIEERELYVNVTHADAIRIMTVHKSKGLEFPVVIIPFLEIDVVVGSGGAGIRKPYVVRQGDSSELYLLQLKKKYGAYCEGLKREYTDEYIRSLIDELNGLYVAFTRAKHELYAFIPSKTGNNKNNLARLLIPSENYTRGTEKEYNQLADKKEKPIKKLPISQFSDNWLDILKDEFKGRAEIINRDKLARGTVIHFILSCAGNLHTENKDVVLKTARKKVRVRFPYVRDLDECVLVAQNILEDQKFKPFFYLKKGSVYREKEVVDRLGRKKVIDRLIITPKETWVVDYKSSRDETGLQIAQIKEYMGLAKSLYPKLMPKGFLIYMDTLELEEVYGTGNNL
ncbi:MAG: UvrD-helicase domain-containing protein [Candidatus Omnitrophota bacterium]|nr:UvrD-helicase domain-containing protein [Candidatus Omnitrophota bacterium]